MLEKPTTVHPGKEAAKEAAKETGLPSVEVSPADEPKNPPRNLLRHFPTALVFVLLTSVGLWGHHTDWKMPKFSQLAGTAQKSDQDWCDEHSVPESICVACNANLMSKGKLYGWCRKHSVSECVLDHPEIAQLKQIPEIGSLLLERSHRALLLKKRKKNNSSCKLHLRRIQFVSRQAVEKAGIDIGLVDQGLIVESVEVSGEVVYDPTRIARLSSRAAGNVWRVEKKIGDQVSRGTVLALIDCEEAGRTKADLLQSVARLKLQTENLRRLSGLRDVVPGRRLQEVETERSEAEIAVRKSIQKLVNLGLPITYDDTRGLAGHELARRIHFLGIPQTISYTLDPGQTTSNLIPLKAPRDGVIVRRDVVAGEVVDRSKTLFTIVDTSQMWLSLDVPLEEAKYIRLEQTVLFRPDGMDQEQSGQVSWISTEVDINTRTVNVRVELANQEGLLRNESFGTGKIILRRQEDAVIVPKDAIHWEGCCHVAFVRDKDYFKKNSFKVFHTRMVTPGVTNGDHTEVIAGLLPGEVVVTVGSGILRAELLKGNLGAG